MNPAEQPVQTTITASQSNNSLPVYTMDQIADQLTTGYWGGSAYKFNASVGDTLTVNLSGLTQAGQEMARQALDAWADATGLNFSEVSASQQAPSGTVVEGPDASSGTSTAYSMSVGEDFEGALAGGPDRDAVAITLAAGERITLALEGNTSGGNAVANPHLRLRDSSGALIMESVGNGEEALLAFEAPSAGTYYLQAGALNDAEQGDYRLEARSAAGGADIVFDDNNSGAYASFYTSGGFITQSTVNIDDNWSGGQSRTDGYYFQTYLHEIGHALGLGHAGNYNGNASYPNDADYANDSWQASVMSYFWQTENTFIDADFAYVITPQVADIIAIQNLYGTASLRTGDDEYGPDSALGTYLDGALDLANPVSFTVLDTGGTDTFDFVDYSVDQRMDLREEAFSDLAGVDGNIGIARGTVIEYGLTGAGNDTIDGNQADNGLDAGAGDDVIRAGTGHDAVSGGTGGDDLTGDGGRDLLEGSDGDDVLNGSDGGDLLFGDDVTLSDLTSLFPSWTPEPDAATKLADGNLLSIWEDILFDEYGIA